MLSDLRSPIIVALLLAFFTPASPTAAKEEAETNELAAYLFNGVDLDGWDAGEVISPEAFEKMTYQQWYDYRKRNAQALDRHWRIDQGELIGTGDGPDLVTWRHYEDFELSVEWKSTTRSDAGVGVRYGATIRLQSPGDQADNQTPSNTGSGGLMNNHGPGKAPSIRADKPAGQWNTLLLRMVGPFVNVELNGETVVDNKVVENIFDRDRPIPRTGPIHLQTFSGQTHFRNLTIRELDRDESSEFLNQILGEEDRFEPIFNGKDLDGWAGATNGYEVIDGALRCKRRDGGNIQTTKQYDNFVVRMEFKLSPGGNNGLLIRTPNTNPTHTRDTLEIQILDDNHIMHRQIAGYQYHGSAYGFTPAIRGYLRPTGQWNYQETYVKDDHVKVNLNGYTILDTHLKQIAPDHPAANTQRGHFGLSGYSDPISFRHLRIKEIK